MQCTDEPRMKGYQSLQCGAVFTEAISSILGGSIFLILSTPRYFRGVDIPYTKHAAVFWGVDIPYTKDIAVF